MKLMRLFPEFRPDAVTSHAMAWAGVATLIALTGVMLGIQLQRDYDRTIASTEDRLLAEARVVDENLGAKLAFINILLKDISRIVKASGRIAEADLNRHLLHEVQTNRGIRTLVVTDPRGRIILASREDIIGLDSAGRAYYRSARDAENQDRIIISPPFTSLLETTVVNVSRAITGNKGEFIGVVAATLDEEYFATLLRSVLYAPDNGIMMVHDNGDLFLSLPKQQGPEQKSGLARHGTFFQRHRESGSDVSLLRGPSVVTGEDRIAVAITSRSPEVNIAQPFVLIVDRSTSEVLAPWRRDVLVLVTLYVLFAATSVIILVVLLKWRVARRKAEKEHERLRSLESAGILAGGIAHDFNNLLAAISGHIQMAKEGVRPGGEAHEVLTAATDACLRAKELSRRLLTFATGGEPVRMPMPIQRIIAESVERAIKNTNVAAETSLPDDLHPVPVDEGQIRQVFAGLVNNAVEAMPQGGRLVVRGENVSISPRSGLALPDGIYVKVTIGDTGVGIAAENLPKIFDPYYSTKDTFSQKGLGLSLAVCHSIIRRHGGLVTVSSEVGAGTAITVFLPTLTG
jgi:signal transduction histidine kinase